MTAIVGVVHDGVVVVGSDSQMGGWTTKENAGPKVFLRDGVLIGVSGSIRIHNLLQYKLSVPREPAGDHPDYHSWMVCEFIPAVRTLFQDEGINLSNENRGGDFFDGGFLVGYRGHLFEVFSNYAVVEPPDGYATTGSGWAVALGALAATPHLPPRDRVRTALEATVRHAAGVGGDIHILSLPE